MGAHEDELINNPKRAKAYMAKVGAPRVAFETLFPIFNAAKSKLTYISKDTIVVFFPEEKKLRPLEFKYKDPSDWRLTTL